MSVNRDEGDVVEDEACRALLMVRGGSGEDGTWSSTWWHLAERAKAGSPDTLRSLGQILGVGPHMRAQDTNNTDSLLVLWVKPCPVPLLYIPLGTEANVLIEHLVKLSLKQLQSREGAGSGPAGLARGAVPPPCCWDRSGDHWCHFVNAECQALE